MTHHDLDARMAEFQRVIEDRDVAAADKVLHRDYALCLVVPTATVHTRDAWLAALPAYVVHEWDVQERQVEVQGDTAVVLQRAWMRATVFDIPRNGIFVITDAWLRQDGVWRIWKRHSTPLSAGELALA